MEMSKIVIAYIKKSKKHLHCLMDDSRFLQQVLGYLRSHHRPATCELHLQVFAEATRVLIDDSASVSESFHKIVDQ